METKKTYTKAEAAALRERLLAEPPRKDETLRVAQLVMELRPALAAKLRQGWTWEMLSDWLGQNGVELSAKSLREYFRKGKKRKQTRAPRAKKEANELPQNSEPAPQP